MKKYLGILLALSFSSSLWAGATFSRAHNWVDLEVLTASDLNNEFNNILNNLDPAGVDDYSLTLSQMQTTVDPYPAAVESLATDLKGEIERLRYQVLQLKKSIQTNDSTYWYQDTPGQGTFTIGTSSVGVNNTSPSYSLDVVGTQRVTGNAIFSSSASIANTLVVSTITSTLPILYITTDTSISGNLTVGGTFSGTIANLTVDGFVNFTKTTLVLASKNSTQTIPFNTSNMTITNTTSVDRNSEMSSGIFTAKNAGVYFINVQYLMSNSAGVGSCDGTIGIFKNSTDLISTGFSVDSTDTYLFSKSLYLNLVANDTVTIKVSRSSAGYSGAGIVVNTTTADLGQAELLYRIP